MKSFKLSHIELWAIHIWPCIQLYTIVLKVSDMHMRPIFGEELQIKLDRATTHPQFDVEIFLLIQQAEFCQNASRLRWFYDVSPEGFFDTADVQEFSAIPLWTRQLMDADSATVLFVSRAIYCFHVKKMAGHKSHLKHSKGRWVGQARVGVVACIKIIIGNSLLWVACLERTSTVHLLLSFQQDMPHKSRSCIKRAVKADVLLPEGSYDACRA